MEDLKDELYALITTIIRIANDIALFVGIVIMEVWLKPMIKDLPFEYKFTAAILKYSTMFFLVLDVIEKGVRRLDRTRTSIGESRMWKTLWIKRKTKVTDIELYEIEQVILMKTPEEIQREKQ